MRILAGGPAREAESDLYQRHKSSMEAQRSDGQTLTFHSHVVEDTGGPKWHGEKIDRVAKARQAMLDWADKSYDALFMVDTDLILGPLKPGQRLQNTP